ncbi:MAG: hypothetical protein MUO62_09055 [Anaerolineales bacterium]|nr:hypothetical protein [Anaerolineales bacterium]
MAIYQQPFWGYELDLPDSWVHQTIQDTEGFASIPEALQPEYEGPNLGHLLIRGEWNCSLQAIEPRWNQHLARLAIMLGAKNLGSAQWRMAGAIGFEAEIMLPTKTKKRLWVGILGKNTTILHFMVTHWMEERQWFEPLATEVISSLRFVDRAARINTDETGLPIPPGYQPTHPKTILPDIADLKPWRAYQGTASVGGLQAFYVREIPNHGWEVDEYVPYPSQVDLGFARLKLHKGNYQLTLGILPFGESPTTGVIVIKDEP